MKKISLTLEPSEAVVVRAAAMIYAAHVAAGHVVKGQETEMIAAAVRDAIALATSVDEAIQSDSEMS